MKLFISQPMKGRTKEEIMEERKQLLQWSKNKLCEHDLEVIDSYFENAPHDAPPLYYLGEAIKQMADADAVVFAKNWEEYHGCYIEHECAVRYKKKCIYF